jgi:hypothetical protein
MVKKYIILLLLLLLTNFSYSQVDDDDNLLIMFIEEPVSFERDLKKFIQSEINYPISAKKDSIEGIVYISLSLCQIIFIY